MIKTLILFAAYLLDRIIGDPRWLPHPVVLMGESIKQLEKAVRRCVSRERALKAAGLLFPICIAGGSGLLVWLILLAAARIHPWLAAGLEVVLISTTIATKGLADAGMEIYRHLQRGDLAEARRSLSMVVGRDTERLDQPEICRGAVETVAENIVDAIISPLFYAAIGGAPLAFVYRAANTLDSMVGYKNERYLHLGWASARFDDVLNYIPARLTGVMLVAVSMFSKIDWKGCWRTILRDARLHPSPNSGIPEAGIAGALGIQLGGTNYYQGIASHRARMGEPTRAINPEDIRRTVDVMKKVSVLCLLLFAVGVLLNQIGK
ncbi:adenosylcobinamide-phosphate synthase CbiB [Brevibacillus migulae]|uniref:adenosylcobinamide-phosphate synthase CbiB n=1 Tax=Brevibacillus migulae TaxID=1644114 RepID=UPI00106EAE39|nr:adenosylcobinamide-phosphate synthase CbiB [Brevibacillus migulae]